MRPFAALLALLPAALTLASASPPLTVDLLAPLGLQVNAAGPLLVRIDPARGRLVVANTLSSSLTLIDCRTRAPRNIAVASRVPQHLKAEALAIDERSGNVYVIGERTLEVVFPDGGTSRSFATEVQFEMVAVDERSGAAFLVGRESRRIARVDLKRGAVSTLPFAAEEERARNLNQTPPPPLRKVVCDGAARLLLAVDGYSATLHLYDPDSLRRLGTRRLALEAGGRWHFAGYSRRERAMVLVLETAGRKVVQAAKVAADPGNDRVVPLPGLSEAVGVRYSEERDELYIPYDNHPVLHVVDFKERGPGAALLSEVMLPAYGNDATALDVANGLLYVASWAYGEVDQVDLAARRLRRRFPQVPVLPHMFSMEFNPGDGRLYVPLGATAVNGAFGAAITAFDPASERVEKIRTGWAPQELLRRPGGDSFLAFSSEDQMARIDPDGSFAVLDLPALYPHRAQPTPAGNVYLAYGPHQSYWPVVYIWAARNGILGIDGRDLSFYDRRIPRLAQAMALSPGGALYALQNNWGDEKQFYVRLDDEVRAPNQGDMRVELEDTVSRETTQRLLAYDAGRDWLLAVRCGEQDGDHGILQVIDARAGKVLRRLEVGTTPTDLAVGDGHVYVANFDSGTVSVVGKDDFSRRDVPCGRQPLKVALAGATLYAVCHGDNTLFAMAADGGGTPKSLPIPFPGTPDQLAFCQGRLWIASHDRGELVIGTFDPATGTFALRLRHRYPYGQAGFAGANSSFFLRGQFGDCVYDLCQVRAGAGGSVWISDFLAGKVFIFAAGK
jgi:DNA-binding beta-propeller fold protein YncE